MHYSENAFWKSWRNACSRQVKNNQLFIDLQQLALKLYSVMSQNLRYHLVLREGSETQSS